MTREIAIGIIKELQNKPLENRELTALDLAISALERKPCNVYEERGLKADTIIIDEEAQEPCEDAVSRDMALEKMADYVTSGYADSVEDFEEYSRIICQLPSVTQKPIECDDAVSRKDVRKVICVMYGKNLTDIVYQIDMLPSVTLQRTSNAEKHVENTLDAVSREAVIEWLKDKDIIKLKSQEELARKELNELPSVTQKSGKWHIAHGMYEDRFWCSCGYIKIVDSRMNDIWKYCPVCGGARMVEPQESEDKE